MDINKKKKAVAALSVISNLILSVSKIVVGIISGSISILSEAIHSMSDLLASALTLFSVNKSSKPADKDHPYGHGKYEDMAGFIEGLLIIFAAFFIVYKSVQKIILGIHCDTEAFMGIIVMLAAVIMNAIVSFLLFKVAKESNSVSLYADGEHLRTDIYSSLGVMLGLLLIHVTGHTILDPIIAIMVAVFIYLAGCSIVKRTLRNLLDYTLPNDEIKKIKQIIQKFSDVAKLKKNTVKARQVGPSTDIDFVLQFPHDTSICECHKICEEIEQSLLKVYPNSSISIHSEPICYKKKCKKMCSENKQEA